MSTASENNKRIAKNTMLLYVRMIFLMLITLYTSRVILNALGVTDFGIYNVVGGVVAMFSVISGSLSASITRFITFELGKGDKEKLAKIFSSSVTIQILLGLLIIVLVEIIGVWFLNVKMNIPHGRMIAANWVLQFSLITFFVNLISVPYNACIIAHEKMSAFAYISIIEASGKLVIAFLILVSPLDKLIFYAILQCFVAVVIRFIYGYYCKKHFEECDYHFLWDRELLGRMFSFAGWNFIGASSSLLRDEGGNIVINLFCGPAVNAARGIAMQVNGAVNSFVQSFTTAINPQITKSYSSGDKEYMMTLIFKGSRFSFYLLLILSIPIIINTDYILKIWLNVVPAHTVLFVQLILIHALCESISYPLVTAMLATGNIRNYQIIVGGIQMINLPISYILLRMGLIPEIVIVVAIVISQICLVARLFLLRKMIALSAFLFFKKVYINIILVAALSSIFPLYFILRNIKENFFVFFVTSLVSIILTTIAIVYVGLSKKERSFLLSKIIAQNKK